MEPDIEHLLREILFRRAQLEQSGPVSTSISDVKIMDEIEQLTAQVMVNSAMHHVACFMVDFCGKDETTPQESDVANIGEFVLRLGGPLAQNISSFLARAGYVVTDSGGGVGGWHMGVHCTPGQAWQLYRDAYRLFKRAIAAGLLTVTIKPWSLGERKVHP